MKVDSIQAMIADPRIDPTSWVGKALLTWIKDNPTECLSDPVSRGYLFRGMELSDLEVLGDGVCAMYAESQDATLIQNYINGVNRVSTTTDKYGAQWVLSHIARALNNIVDESTIDSICTFKMPDGDTSYASELVKFLKPRHILPLIRSRKPKWAVQHWHKIIDTIPRDEIFELVTGEIWEEHLNKYRSRDWPNKVQSILWQAFIRLPKYDAERWLNFLEKTNARAIWHGNAEDLISKSYNEDTLYFSKTTCPCGVVTKSRSGYALHRHKCLQHKAFNLYQAATIFVGMATDKVICIKCGKTCKSKPGLALHTKKCKATVGPSIIKARRLQEELEYVDATSNTLS